MTDLRAMAGKKSSRKKPQPFVQSDVPGDTANFDVQAMRKAFQPTDVELLQKQFNNDVQTVLDAVGAMLAEKNRKYGDAALNPKRVFSRLSAYEQIKVRLDDKLSRLANQRPDEDEDVVSDLLGYLVLMRVAMNREKLKVCHD